MGRRYSFKNSKRRWFLDDVRFVHESLPIQFLFVIFLVSLSSRTNIRRYNSDSFLVISSLLQNIIEDPRSSLFHRSTRRFSILRFLFSFFDFLNRPREIPSEFVVLSTDLLTNRVPPMCRFSITGPVYHPAQQRVYQAAFLIESGARDHSCRPIFKGEPSGPLARGHPRTPRVRVRGPKWQSCSVSYVTPPRLLCFSLVSRKSLGNIYINI